MDGFLRRMKALIHKEFLQLFRDNASLLLGIVLPIVLILIIGFGISLDVKHVPTAVVLEDSSPTARDVVSFVEGSPYFDPRYVTSVKEAVDMMDKREINTIICVPGDFTSSLAKGRAHIQVILYGVDATTAMSAQNYIEASLGNWLAKQGSSRAGMITAEPRMWFNAANSSTWFFIPGLIMLIMTLIGVLLTSVVMAREWERGTFESLFVTPVKPVELVLAKMVTYFCVAMTGTIICIFLSRFLYEVPIHGSLILLMTVSTLYLLVALGIGLVISAITKNQFLSCQMSLLISFLPCVMLSGFVFDLRSVPVVVRGVGYLLPFSHYLVTIKSLFLAGNLWSVILKQAGLLSLYAIFFVGLAFSMTRKKVE